MDVFYHSTSRVFKKGAPGAPYRRPDEEAVQQFQAYLLQHAIATSVRQSRGGDISAACGQLRYEERATVALTGGQS